MSYLVRFILCVLIAASSVTTAWECRRTPSVLNSAKSLENNAAAGGHVWIHVLGLRRPFAGTSRQTVRRTMFASFGDFNRAWNMFAFKYQTQATFADCNRRAVGDCIPAQALGIERAYVCRTIDPDTGLCDHVRALPSQGLNIAFWYIWRGGQWILNTAYPTTLPNCKRVYSVS